MSKGKVLALSVALAMGLSSAAALAEGDAKAGAKVFKKRCFACHTINKGGKNKVGPNLWGVFGRASGTMEGFKFSDAMTEAGITWDDATMAQYLAKPKDMVPGTKMAFAGLRTEKQIANVIAYLKQATQ